MSIMYYKYSLVWNIRDKRVACPECTCQNEDVVIEDGRYQPLLIWSLGVGTYNFDMNRSLSTMNLRCVPSPSRVSPA